MEGKYLIIMRQMQDKMNLLVWMQKNSYIWKVFRNHFEKRLLQEKLK